MPLKIAILGGGPAGLMSALALERYAGEAVDLTLFDRNTSETDYPGVEYGIQERACRALERIGLREAALRRGNLNTEIVHWHIRHPDRRGVVKTDPAWCRCVNRQEFLADLAGLLQRTTVSRRTDVIDVQPSTDGRAAVSCRARNATSAETHTFDLVIAADGVHSVVRPRFFPKYATTHDRGFSCLYFLVEVPAASAPAHFAAMANGTRSELIMGTRSTMALFPLGRDRLAIGIGFDHATRAQLWREVGAADDAPWATLTAAHKQAVALRLAADVPAYDGLFTTLFTSHVPDWDSFRLYLWQMRDSDPLPTPVADDCNVVVIGDAAHAFTPTIGMGASLAIEDAERLGARVAAVITSSATPDEARRMLRTDALLPFGRERYPVWKDLMSRARRAAAANFTAQHKRHRFALAPMVPGRVASTLMRVADWIADRKPA